MKMDDSPIAHCKESVKTLSGQVLQLTDEIAFSDNAEFLSGKRLRRKAEQRTARIMTKACKKRGYNSWMNDRCEMSKFQLVSLVIDEAPFGKSKAVRSRSAVESPITSPVGYRVEGLVRVLCTNT